MSAPLSPHRALVLGAGRGQVRLIRAFRALGVPVYVATQMHAALPGLSLADEVVEVDIRDAHAVVQKAVALGITAVATSCMDTAMHTLGHVVSSLGLRGLSEDSALLCNNKIAMKRRLAEHNIPTAAYVVIQSREELDAAIETLGLPAVIKAPDLQGSNGVYIVHSAREAHEAYTAIRPLSPAKSLLVEQFLVGMEFGAQAFVHNGEVLFVLPHGDALAASDLPVPVEHSVPLEVPSSTLAQCEDVVRRAIVALGLDNCAVNVDLFLVDGNVYVIELTGRVGANGLPEMTEAALGLDYMELVAREALDLDVKEFWQTRNPQYSHVIAYMLNEPELFGEITGVATAACQEPWLIDRTLFVTEGSEVKGFRSSNDCVGQVIVAASSTDEARARLKSALNDIVLTVK